MKETKGRLGKLVRGVLIALLLCTGGIGVRIASAEDPTGCCGVIQDEECSFDQTPWRPCAALRRVAGNRTVLRVVTRDTFAQSTEKLRDLTVSATVYRIRDLEEFRAATGVQTIPMSLIIDDRDLVRVVVRGVPSAALVDTSVDILNRTRSTDERVTIWGRWAESEPLLNR